MVEVSMPPARLAGVSAAGPACSAGAGAAEAAAGAMAAPAAGASDRRRGLDGFGGFGGLDGFDLQLHVVGDEHEDVVDGAARMRRGEHDVPFE